jgi:hypothetical protein
MEPLQLGVGIPSGYQIGAKGAQCAYDARRAVKAFDLNSAFTKEQRQDTFKGVHKQAPHMLSFYVWGYDRETPLLWRRHRVRLVGIGETSRPIILRSQYFWPQIVLGAAENRVCQKWLAFFTRSRMMTTGLLMRSGDSEGGMLCRCNNKRADLHSDDLHFSTVGVVKGNSFAVMTIFVMPCMI